MNDPRPILFLDLATRTGWCEGVPGGKPTFGSTLFAPEGAGSGAIFGGAFKWLAERCQSTRYRAIYIEAPLDPRHMGNRTTRMVGLRLIGLPAVMEAAAYLCKQYVFEEVRADDVRLTLLGYRPKAAEAKQAVMKGLKALGFDVDDPDAADALAGWLHVSQIVAPEIAHKITPLFAEKPKEPDRPPNTRKPGEAYDPYRGL